jgi:hypothetical protein
MPHCVFTFKCYEDAEGDVYESDFESTDEEAEAEIAGETEIQAEARQARRVQLRPIVPSSRLLRALTLDLR